MPAPAGVDKIKKPRQGRIHRRPELAKIYPMEMIQQGWQTLEALDRFRCMTSSQVARLLFLDQPTSKGHRRSAAAAHNAANAVCLSRLKDRGLVTVVPSYRREGARTLVRFELNTLTRAGHDALIAYKAELEEPFASRWTPKTPTLTDFSLESLPHRLAVTDAIIAIEIACRKHSVELALWRDEDEITQLAAAGVIRLSQLVPDALVVLRHRQRLWPLLIEVDRGTESLTGVGANRWQRKIERYEAYLAEGLAQDPFFAGCAPPAVLTITTGGDERLYGLLDATRVVTTRPDYWFTRAAWMDPAQFDVFGPIWLWTDHLDQYHSLADMLLGG